SWFGLIQKLEYKAKAQGKYLVKIDQWFASSKTCSCCGHQVDSLPLSVRNWTCPACAAELDRDINAAINIRQQGIIKLRAEGLSAPANGGLRKSGHAPVAA
ncbi:RNA-guided endonuclease InsQ/TnpB family protein, partial [Vreelandella venusta]|uniref:RNA-guided endonuclease InsQ/TnpB family protein n=1 Tax=Vreelandella venusta TaxID=44935 RepID=UPI003C2CFF9C